MKEIESLCQEKLTRGLAYLKLFLKKKKSIMHIMFIFKIFVNPSDVLAHKKSSGLCVGYFADC